MYRGPDASKKTDKVLASRKCIHQFPKDMIMTPNDLVKAKESSTCCLCNQTFTLYDDTYNRRVRHHNHMTGAFVGMAHNECNLKCPVAEHIPVIFHNLKNFEAHILCKSIGNFKDHKLSCIAQTDEKYVSFTRGYLRFIDSFQFLPSSLETLVSDLSQNGLPAMPHLQSEFEEEKAKLLMRKQVYPYKYFSSYDQFHEPNLPPRKAFYSSLTRDTVTKEDYQHALNVYEKFGSTSLGEFHDLYLKSDVVLLCDVLESFRSLSIEQYGLDPCHFMTSPGLSWAACLKMTNVSLELLTDINKILFVERATRGGISQISHRHKKANNPKLDDYDPNLPTFYLMYFDMNNLYGWALSQPLPVDSFHWLKENEIQRFNVQSIPVDNDFGYILEVTLHYPAHLHDLHNDYPLAPERKVITDEELSPNATNLWKKLHSKLPEDSMHPRGKTDKLILSLND